MNFVSIVGISLLISVWICLHTFTAPGLIVLHLEERKKTKQPPVDFEPTKQVLLVFLDVVGRGSWALLFSFPVAL